MRRWRLILLVLVMGTRGAATELETLTVVGNPRTFGVDFEIDRPAGWFTRNTPLTGGTIASYWSSPEGVADAFSIVVPQGQKIVPHATTKEELNELFRHPELTAALGRSVPEGKVLRQAFLPDLIYPTGYVDYTGTIRLPDGPHTVIVKTYVVYLRNVMVQVQFYFPVTADLERIKQRDVDPPRIIASLRMLPSRN